MKYNTLGNTGMCLSEFGLGGSSFSDAFGFKFEDETGVEIVKKAILEYGINYIDVAPWYGHTRAEKVIGKALAVIDRKKYYVSTKVGRYLPEISQMFDFSAERTLKSIDESLSRLQISYVDIAYAHDVEFAPSIDIIINETLPALQKMKDNGKIRFIGITGYSIVIMKEIIERSTIKLDVVLSYCRGTLFNNDLQNYVSYFKEKGIGIVNAAVLGMGLLTENGPPKWHPGNNVLHLEEACINAVKYCKSKDIDVAKLALHYSITQNGVASNLVSIGKTKYLDQNISYIQTGLDNSEKECLDYIQEHYFKPLKQTHWEGFEVEKYWRKLKAEQLQQ